MNVKDFVNVLGVDFYTGVPDSLLKALCNYLMNIYGIDPHHHIIAANEGNCVALAAGYHLSTGKIPVVYMQNSGEGNIINPVASLLSEHVYAIPTIFIVGWRGEPGVHDEPQHVYQGKITVKLLDDMNIDNVVISKNTSLDDVITAMCRFKPQLLSGKSVAFVIKKGALSYDEQIVYSNGFSMTREDIIRCIVQLSGGDPIVSTTGKASRELYETRISNNQEHKYDFLTVGSMGHSSSIALGVAINKPETKVWCIDGDGAVLMHMGSMAVIGSIAPNNLIHILINNGAHETVGGMPTVGLNVDFVEVAKACGYRSAVSVEDLMCLEKELIAAKQMRELSFIEIKCGIGSRDNLGRPTTTALENKERFMEYLNLLS